MHRNKIISNIVEDLIKTLADYSGQYGFNYAIKTEKDKERKDAVKITILLFKTKEGR